VPTQLRPPVAELLARLLVTHVAARACPT